MTQPLSWTIHGNDRLSEILEKLDRNLDKLARKMDQTGDEAAQMGRKVGQAEAPTNRLGSAADHTSGRLDHLSERMSGVMSRVGAMAAAIAAAAAIGVAALGAMAVKTASANEQAAISFELLLGSAQKASAFLDELKKFSAATPFEMPQLRTAASRLLAVGTATKDIIPLLTALGDATSGMGTGAEGIERSVTALTQMSQKTKVTAEEMLQLTEAGIPAWQTLAAFLKVDVATAMKMVERRTVDATAVFQALETKAGPAMQRLSGMMARQSTTLAGVWSTFKDNAGQALATFADPALPGLKKLIDFLGAGLPGALSKLRSMAGEIRDVFKGTDVDERFMAALKTLGEKALPIIEGSWNRIVKALRDNREGLEKLGRFIADFVVPLFGETLLVSIQNTVTVLEGLIWVAARVVDAVKFLAESWLGSMGLILKAAVATYGWVPVLGDKLKEAEAGFDRFAKSVMDKLNALDGKTVTFNMRVQWYGSNAAAARAAAGDDSGYGGGRAAGGPVWPGQVYTWREQGRGEGLMLNGMSGTVVTEQGMRSAQSGRGGGEIVGVLKVVHETPGGKVIREELLQLKRQRGFGALGLA